jgi:hypothetical protein
MQVASTEKFLAKLLAFTGAFTTIFLISGSVTDPVNTPKMLAIGVLSSAAIATVATSKLRNILLSYKILLSIFLVFFIAIFISSVASKAPLTQVLYGSYGRNNGVLTYVFLSFVLLSALCLNSRNGFLYIVNGLLVAGIINLAYGLWVMLFGDFVGWENPYKSILGTFGNPNFIGAFLGIIFSATVAILLDQKSAKLIRYSALAILPICVIEILNTNAIQGRVVAAFGTAIVIFLFIRSKFGNWVLIGYSTFSLIAGLLALAGAFQIGPLTQFIYKTSVSLRGQYWLAGWNTGQEHPFTGVGMDSFGDWYRRMRDAQALELPGVNTVVNAAHNVPLDIFAFGGWPLFVSYLLVMGYAGLSIIKLIRRVKDFDLITAIFVSGWAGYQLQSIISINQIGLAIWGWMLSGAVIAYERATVNSAKEIQIEGSRENNLRLKKKSTLPAQVPLYATIGGVIGLLIAIPPVAADAKWRSSMKVMTLPALEETMKISYFNPPNSMKYLRNIETLEQSNLNDLSRKYALEAVKWNSDVFDLWKILYFIKNSTTDEKALALENMKRLDPLNPDVTSIQ